MWRDHIAISFKFISLRVQVLNKNVVNEWLIKVGIWDDSSSGWHLDCSVWETPSQRIKPNWASIPHPQTLTNACCFKLLNFVVNGIQENIQACTRRKYMCTLVLTSPMGGFSKHNAKERKYRDRKFDY